MVWCEDEERSIQLQVERKVKVNTQGKDRLLLLKFHGGWRSSGN